MTGEPISSPPKIDIVRVCTSGHGRAYIYTRTSAQRARVCAHARCEDVRLKLALEKGTALEEGSMRVPRYRQELSHEKMACGCRKGISPGYLKARRLDYGTCECCGRSKEWVERGWWPAKGDERRHNKPTGIHLMVCADCMRDMHVGRAWKLTYGKNH